MKITKIQTHHTKQSVQVLDCFVDSGYTKVAHGSLPDVDSDYQSDRRQEVKEYIERRYNHDGKQRVFSAGTFATLKAKAVIKDVARTMRISPSLVNYLTAIFEDDSADYTDIFKLAATNRKVAKFIHDYPQLFEDIRTLMFQPRSSSVHASALLVTPDEMDGEDMECFDFAPIKKVDDILVSENSGYDLDELGLLKNDCLGTKELSKLHETFDLVNEHYGQHLTMEDIVESNLDDVRTYELLRQGYTQNVFQLSSRGMTKFLVEMQPTNIHDLIAANALFRPATLENGSTEAYVDRKKGLVAPTYLWGTYNSLKDTFGTLCIAEGTLIKTSTGQKRIEDVVEGECVQTEDGSYHKVEASYYKGRQNTITIRTTHGMELRCTPDHKVLTQHGWMPAKYLVPRKHCIKGFWLYEDNIEVGTLKDWCVGIYLANGTWGTTSSIACKNQEEAEKIAQLFDEAFDLQCKVYFHCRCWYVQTTYRPLNNKPNPFKEHLRALGLEKKKSYDKNVDTMSLMMLTGFVEGDGCIKNGMIRIKNIKLAKTIFRTFQSLKIPSSIYSTIENDDVVWNVSFLEDKGLPLQIHRHKAFMHKGYGAKIPSTYLSTVDTTPLEKHNRNNIKQAILRDTWCYLNRALEYGAKIDHEVWGLVLSIKDAEPKITYDLSISTNHSFVSGGLVTHNCFQEQVAQMAREVGGFSLGEGVKLVKFISKKKTDKIQAMRDKFLSGAKKNGCPIEDAIEIWAQIEACGSYLFNKSHATAYAVTSYIGAYLKATYPTAFYTVALEWADDKELIPIMSEMEACSNAKVASPDINKSAMNFYTDYEANQIFWSLSRIKMVGAKAVDWIINERNKNGNFTSIVNFIERVFKYKLKKYEYWDDPDNEDEVQRCPVNARHVLNLILAGCFDKIENALSVVERYAIVEKAAECLGFKIKAKDFPEDLIDKHYFWSQQQIKVSGLGAIDYKRIYDNSAIKNEIRGRASYTTLKDTLSDDKDGRKVAIAATIVEMEEKKFTSKKTGEQETFCKLTLQQNNDMGELVIWPEEYRNARALLFGAKNKLIICMALCRYSEYVGHNNLQMTRNNLIEII